jgi:hypothetical protein
VNCDAVALWLLADDASAVFLGDFRRAVGRPVDADDLRAAVGDAVDVRSTVSTAASSL